MCLCFFYDLPQCIYSIYINKSSVVSECSTAAACSVVRAQQDSTQASVFLSRCGCVGQPRDGRCFLGLCVAQVCCSSVCYSHSVGQHVVAILQCFFSSLSHLTSCSSCVVGPTPISSGVFWGI